MDDKTRLVDIDPEETRARRCRARMAHSILAKTVKGYGMGDAGGEGQNITHRPTAIFGLGTPRPEISHSTRALARKHDAPPWHGPDRSAKCRVRRGE
ncbi:MAG: hypothetical protein ACREYF_19185 [Gammaproteobacteria bacterium]